MQDKRERIVAAASALFAERGFEGATTQEIADRADVAAGTVFRYAATKGELFLLVYNERFRAAVARGEADAGAAGGLEDAVCARVRPVVLDAGDGTSSAVYQRELLFGATGEEHRAAGLALVLRLEEGVAAQLLAAVDESRRDEPEVRRAAERAARSVFAVLNLLLVQPHTGAHAGTDRLVELDAQVRQVVRGFLASVSPEPGSPAG